MDLPPGTLPFPISTGWQLRHSRSNDNRPYYFHAATGTSQWEAPSRSTPASQSPSRVGGEPTVHAYHILLKHSQSRRPSSWRQEVITMTPDEALCEIKGRPAAQPETLIEIREQLTLAPDLFAAFKDAATQRSDCSSAKKSGDLGPFALGQMQSISRLNDGGACRAIRGCRLCIESGRTQPARPERLWRASDLSGGLTGQTIL